jgi:flavin reductase (DIM6/NTAB) family NADH-FMN oxidoreductase RutF
MRQYLPGWLKRRLGKAPAHGAPPSSFMRVAYRAPRQVVLLTARHEGAENVWPIDWHTPLSLEPELYGIALNKTGYGTELIRNSGAFVINFVPATWEEQILFCGRTSGRAVDKFAAAGLAKEAAETIDAPRLAEALGWLECRVEQVVEAGDHTFFISRVTLSRFQGVNAPRLHHLDSSLKEIAEEFE